MSERKNVPLFGILAGEPEIIGERCADGGKCHHKCKDVCSRKLTCVPLTGSRLQSDWTSPVGQLTYEDVAKAAKGGQRSFEHFVRTNKLPKSEKCVHTEHCCFRHGCKYGDDNCPVALGIKLQSYLCESCDYDSEEEAILDDKIAARLSDPEAVFVNMLRGTIAKPSLRSMIELYSGEILNDSDALQLALIRANMDSSRLTWLERAMADDHPCLPSYENEHFGFPYLIDSPDDAGVGNTSHDTLRDAIDDAMSRKTRI